MRYILLSLLLFTWASEACTTLCFSDQNHERVFGKNFDWYDYHGLAYVNKRNVQKTALLVTPGLPLRWVSKFGSVTFNQYGIDFPMGGMNEAGLVVEIMNGPVGDIPTSANVQNVNELQLIQFLLDSFQSAAEIAPGMANLRVARVMGDVHYLACDKNSACASIEFLNGKLEIHEGASLPYAAFTNSEYGSSAKFAANFQGLGGQALLPGDTSSLSRFVRAAATTKSFTGGDSLKYTNDFLDSVVLTGEWRIVYRGFKEITLRSKPNLLSTKSISMDFNFSCADPVRVYQMNRLAGGSINQDFEIYTQKLNDLNVDANTGLNAELRTLLKSYPQNFTRCLE